MASRRDSRALAALAVAAWATHASASTSGVQALGLDDLGGPITVSQWQTFSNCRTLPGKLKFSRNAPSFTRCSRHWCVAAITRTLALMGCGRACPGLAPSQPPWAGLPPMARGMPPAASGSLSVPVRRPRASQSDLASRLRGKRRTRQSQRCQWITANGHAPDAYAA